MEKKKVKFIRKNGRVIPIGEKSGSGAKPKKKKRSKQSYSKKAVKEAGIAGASIGVGFGLLSGGKSLTELAFRGASLGLTGAGLGYLATRKKKK